MTTRPSVAPLLPYGRQLIEEDDIAAVVDVLKSDFLTTGPLIRRFEEALEKETGARHASVVNSGTSALHAAYAAAGIGRGDEVITSPLTFAATANAALYLGARPVFVDIDPDTGTIDPALIEDAVTPETRAIVAIDYAGHPAEYDELRDIAARHGLKLIADAAHSLGGSYRGRRVGTLADLTTLSFHPVKIVTSGEGGAVLTDDQDAHRAVQEFRTHGVTREPERLLRDEGPWHYEVQTLGFNYRLTDVHAALGLSQLSKWQRFVERRRAIARRYSSGLADLGQLRLPTDHPDIGHAWHLYVIRAMGGAPARRHLFDGLRAAGLGVQVHYMPVYLHPLYESLGYQAGSCPAAEAFYQAAVSIPMFPGMTDDDTDRVIDAIHRVAAGL